MGLDITAYSGLKELRARDDDYDNRSIENEVAFCINDAFPGRNCNIKKDVVYSYTNSLDFRAGSYSGYNMFRERLSQIALLVLPAQVWNNWDTFESLPFCEMINFSDCEGVIGTDICIKLAKDFQDFESKIQNEDEYFIEKYGQWKDAFKLASDNGAVEFH